MDCVMEGNCVKVFGKAVQALARLGDDLWLDPKETGLAMRSVSASHSAYACFLFPPLLFQSYSLTSGPQHRRAVRCKVSAKILFPLFRCSASTECSVDRCQLTIASPADRVVIQFFCRHGITRTHNICFQESEALQAVFSPHLCPNVLKAAARLLGDMVMHFPPSQEEIMLSISPQRVSLRNHSADLRSTCTQMWLHPEEFELFQQGVDADVTFCLKELRGFLAFADWLCLPVCVHSAAAGMPMCFSVEDLVLQACVVLATQFQSGNQAGPQSAPSTEAATARCRGAAADLLVVWRENADGCAPAGPELVASSQGSPVVPPVGCVKALQMLSPALGPAPSQVLSLPFGAALAKEQEADGHAMLYPLACLGDEDKDMDVAMPPHIRD